MYIINTVLYEIKCWNIHVLLTLILFTNNIWQILCFTKKASGPRHVCGSDCLFFIHAKLSKFISLIMIINVNMVVRLRLQAAEYSNQCWYFTPWIKHTKAYISFEISTDGKQKKDWSILLWVCHVLNRKSFQNFTISNHVYKQYKNIYCFFIYAVTFK